jgi:hypothetical protein
VFLQMIILHSHSYSENSPPMVESLSHLPFLRFLKPEEIKSIFENRHGGTRLCSDVYVR